MGRAEKAIIGDVNRRLGVSSVRVGGGTSSGSPDSKENDDVIKSLPKLKNQDKEIMPEIPLKLDPSPTEKFKLIRQAENRWWKMPIPKHRSYPESGRI